MKLLTKEQAVSIARKNQGIRGKRFQNFSNEIKDFTVQMIRPMEDEEHNTFFVEVVCKPDNSHWCVVEELESFCQRFNEPYTMIAGDF